MTTPTSNVVRLPVISRPRPVDLDPTRYGAPFLGKRTWLERRYGAARFLQLAAAQDLPVRWSGPPEPSQSFYGPYDPIRRAYETVGVDLPEYRGVTSGFAGSSSKIVHIEQIAVLFGEAFTSVPRGSEVQTGDVVIYMDDRTPSLGFLPALALDARLRVGVSASMMFREYWETDWYARRRAMVFRLREERCPAPTGPEAA